MTPEEAIEIIWERHMDCEDYRFQFDDYPDGYDFEFDQAILMAAQALEEIQKYREIGTVEECREAVEKQKPKKVIDRDLDFEYYTCPSCGTTISFMEDGYKSHKFCLNCGQAILQEDEDD